MPDPERPHADEAVEPYEPEPWDEVWIVAERVVGYVLPKSIDPARPGDISVRVGSTLHQCHVQDVRLCTRAGVCPVCGVHRRLFYGKPVWPAHPTHHWLPRPALCYGCRLTVDVTRQAMLAMADGG